jgi:hypothetical protein
MNTLLSKPISLSFGNFSNLKKSDSKVVNIPKPKMLSHRFTTMPTLSKNKSRLTTITKVSMDDITRIVEYDSYIITKGVLLFCMFYFSLNWIHYRNLRKEDEEEEKK